MTDIEKIKSVPVTTEDLKRDYEIKGPVYFQTTNRGLWGISPFKRLLRRYKKEPFSLLIPAIEPSPRKIADPIHWISRFDLNGGFEGSVGSKYFDSAFYICIAELRRRCLQAGGDALVGFRYKCFLDTVGYSCFYIQVYATAVKLAENGETDDDPPPKNS